MPPESTYGSSAVHTGRISPKLAFILYETPHVAHRREPPFDFEGQKELGRGGFGVVYQGRHITLKKPVKLAQLSKKPERFVGKPVLIEGRVKAVCQGMGCWVEVEDGKGTSFLAKSLDESVLLPKDCAGRVISVQGVVTKLDAKAHDHEHAVKAACRDPIHRVHAVHAAPSMGSLRARATIPPPAFC